MKREMKMKNIVLAVVFLAVCAQGTPKTDYRHVDEKVKAVWQASCAVRECPSQITWENEETLVYATRAKTGDVWRRFTVATTNLVDISRDEFSEAKKRAPHVEKPTSNRNFIRPSGSPLKSPDGRWTAFLYDGNVWVKSRETGDVQLSYDGAPGNAYNCLMWSPDSQKLAALREFAVGTRQITLVESRPASTVQGRARLLNYRKPGDPVPTRYPALFIPSERRQVPVDVSAHLNQYEVLLDCWLPDSSAFTFTYVGRGFQSCRYVAVDAPSGRVRTLAEESSPKFVFYTKIHHWWLADARHFLWISRRDGWYHLYRVDAVDGSCEQLTRGEWNVRNLLRIDEAKGLLYFMANGFAAAAGEDPYNRHLLRLDLATRTVTDLTPENAEHVVNISPGGTAFVDYYGRPDLPPTTVVRNLADGRVRASFPKIRVRSTKGAGYPQAEVFHAKGRDGKTDIWGTIWRPLDFNPSNRYPVIEYIYAGPHDSHVNKGYPVNPPRGVDLLADGFVIVNIDGMGTENRSRAFHEVCWRNLKDAGFPDRIPWIKAAAATRPWMDLSRVGIYGYSAGGQNALGALLFHGDFYKVAVALAGCHDNRVDKLWWNEQWMGYPLGPWYADNSNVTHAHRLRGDLLLINGELDDNVDPVSTLQVVDALVKANKYFEQLYLPGHTHNLGGAYIDRRILDFFHRSFKGSVPEKSSCTEVGTGR